MARSNGGCPSLAMATVVRNEQRFIAENLTYHHSLGVAKAYVFQDRCTDATAELCRRFPWAQTFRLDPAAVADFHFHTDCQSACMNHALGLARDEGFDWLLSLDADEFAFPAGDADASIVAGSLPTMLAEVSNNIEVVRLRTRELIPLDLGDDAPFWTQRFFQWRQPVVRKFADPITGEVIPCDRVLSHTDGKPILRTSVDAQAWDPHQWVCNQGRRHPERPEYVPLREEWRGVLYHFVATSASHWREKYAKLAAEPAVWPDGTPVHFPCQAWKEASHRLSKTQMDEYFGRWVAMPEGELRAFCAGGQVVEDRTVEQVLRRSGRLEGASTRPPSDDHQGAEPVPLCLSRPRPDSAATHSPTISMAKVDPASLEGFHLLERADGGLFRWAATTARVKLSAPPGDYLLTLDMKELRGLFRGNVKLSLNDAPIPDRRVRVRGGAVQAKLRRTDFEGPGDYWLGMRFDLVDTSGWPAEDCRDLGAAIFEISLRPVRGWSTAGSRLIFSLRRLAKNTIGRNQRAVRAWSDEQFAERPTPPRRELRVALSDDERRSGTLASDKLARATLLLHTRGYVIIERAIPDSVIADVRKHFGAIFDDCRQSHRSGEEFQCSQQHDAVFFVRKSRWRIFPKLRPPFGHPEILANEIALAIMRQFLGSDMICRYVTSDTCVRGAVMQAPHSDVTDLADKSAALMANIPLVTCGPDNGSLEVWPCGSHLWDDDVLRTQHMQLAVQDGANRRVEEFADLLPSERIGMQPGDLLIRNPALWHRGTPNSTDNPRTMLTIFYAKSGVESQYGSPYYNLDRSLYDALDPRVRELFAFAFPEPSTGENPKGRRAS